MLDRILGLDKAIIKVALVESSNPLPELASTVPAAEGLGVGLEMVLRSNSPNNTKLRVRTPNSATPRQVLRPVLSTLTNVANSTGSKWLPDLLFLFLLLFVPPPPSLTVSSFLACCSSQFLSFSYCPVDRRRFLPQL